MSIETAHLRIGRVAMLADNYAWRIEDKASGAVAFVDPAEAAPALAAIRAAGGRLDLILLTHHHADHIAGAEALARETGAKLVGNAADAGRLPKLDIALSEGDAIDLGATPVSMLATPGHTVGHVTYVFGAEAAACGDTVFSLGCGRMFEGSPEQFFASLAKIAALPKDVWLLCGHEYTMANARFARSVDPDNEALRARAEEVDRLRAGDAPTLPVRLADELATNPFLRAKSPEDFARLRAGKDSF